MELKNFFSPSAIGLDLPASSRDEVLGAMVDLLGIRDRKRATMLRLLSRREVLGSTGVGRGIAIPHCRSLGVQRVKMAYGRLTTPIAWESPDRESVSHVFLIVAPPVEVSNQYLPALGQLARLARQGTIIDQLNQADSVPAAHAILSQIPG